MSTLGEQLEKAIRQSGSAEMQATLNAANKNIEQKRLREQSRRRMPKQILESVQPMRTETLLSQAEWTPAEIEAKMQYVYIKLAQGLQRDPTWDEFKRTWDAVWNKHLQDLTMNLIFHNIMQN